MASSEHSSQNGKEMERDDLTTDAKDLMCDKLVGSEETEQKTPTQQFVSPRTITGPANKSNIVRGAIDWSYNGLVAYGSNYTVAVIDTTNMQPVQCLDRHKSLVNNVLWSPKTRADTSSGAATVELVSSDVTGHVIHWDVTDGSPLAVLQDGNKPVIDMAWVPGERNDGLLATLHAPYYLVLWDIDKQAKLWKKGFLDNITSFQINPFNLTEIAFMCNDCILFLDDFNPTKIPSSNGRKFYISSPRVGEFEDTNRTRDRLKKLMKGLVVGDSKPRPDDAMTMSECLSVNYHRSLAQHVVLLYPRDVLIVDLLIAQTVGIVAIDKSVAPLAQVLPARQRDVLFCLHESGSVSVKARRSARGPPSPSDTAPDTDAGGGANGAEVLLNYDHVCQSEVIRQLKGSKVLAVALDPITEKNVVLLLSSGKVVHLELELTGLLDDETDPLCLGQIFKPVHDEKWALPSGVRLLTTGVTGAVADSLTVVRMCPPLTTRNRAQYTPIMAGGTQAGTIQIYNMATGIVEKELSVHNHPVRGIEWTGLTSFISYAFSSGQSGGGGKATNELALTDILSGQSVPLSHSRPSTNPIDIVRVSPLRQYFVVVYKDGPFELWDLRKMSLLRIMPKKFPFVTALEWSPVHSVKSLQARTGEEAPPPSAPLSPVPDSASELVAREHLVFSDTDSHLYHFSVDGSTVKDGIKIPPESGVGLITYIAFKSNQIVQADVDGCLNIWDLKSRSSRNAHTGRGWVRKMRFSPGKANLKLLVLYSDGVDVVDLKNQQYERLSQLKCPKDMVKVVDIDWAAPDTPVLTTEDGFLRIMDLKLTQSASPLAEYTFKEPVCCPALLAPPVYSRLQLALASPPSHPLNFTTHDGFSPDDIIGVNDQLEMMRTESLRAKCSLPDRCLTAALLTRDRSAIDFWTVCRYHLRASERANLRHKEASEADDADSNSDADLKMSNQHSDLEPLDTCYDSLCDPHTYRRAQLERVGVYEWWRGDHARTQKVVERLILLGQTDRAVQLLLDTDLDDPRYYTDAIKACLVATIQSTGAAQSTIKLVATNLIANGKIWEGVQLLCLIGKGLDGCRYLTSYGLWEAAVWLAKGTLCPAETLEVLAKYADHLGNQGEKEQCALVLASQCQWGRLLEQLVVERNAGRAAMLALALRHSKHTTDKSLLAAVKSQLGGNQPEVTATTAC